MALDSWAHSLSSDRLCVKTQTSTRPASPSNLLLPDEETESQSIGALSQGPSRTEGRCQGFLFACLPPEGQVGGGEAGLPGTPPLLSSLTSCPVASSGLRLWGRWKHLRVSWFLYQQAIVWEPSLSFNSGCRLLPSSSPERRMGQSPRLAPPRRKPGLPRWEQPSSPSVSCKPHFLCPFPQSSPSTPYDFGNHRKCQELLSFFPANADTPWLYLSRFSISFSEKSSEPCTSLLSQRRLGREGKF